MSDEQDKGFKVSDKRFWAESAEGATNGSAGAEDGTNGSGGASSGSRAEYPTFVEQLRAQLAEKDQQLREYIAAYKEQVVQGIEDTKERLARENEREIERLRGRLVEGLLPVLDNLDRSMQAGTQTGKVEPLVEGLRLVRAEFAAKLKALGLEPIESVGAKFDPAQHEAIGLVPVTDSAQDGVVVAEVQGGYRLGDRVLRPAQVQVGKKQ